MWLTALLAPLRVLYSAWMCIVFLAVGLVTLVLLMLLPRRADWILAAS